MRLVHSYAGPPDKQRLLAGSLPGAGQATDRVPNFERAATAPE